MILRAMAAIKTIFQASSRRKPLIQISAEYMSPDINYHPSKEDLANQLDKFMKNVLDSAKQFGRWFKNYCIVFGEKTREGETYIPFTFYDDVNESPVIADIYRKIVEAKEDIIKKITSSGEKWKK